MRSVFILLLAFLSAIVLSGCASYMRTMKQQRKISQLSRKYRRVYSEIKYIATLDEIGEFVNLKTAEEREDFLRKFWKRRDPTPTTETNERKIEHERRVKYADLHFRKVGIGIGLNRWDDRGGIYIQYGEPDEIEGYSMGEVPEMVTSGRDPMGWGSTFRGGRHASGYLTKPWEKWYYYKYGLVFDFVEEHNTYELVASADLYKSGDPRTRALVYYGPGELSDEVLSKGLASYALEKTTEFHEQLKEIPVEIYEPKYKGEHLVSLLDIATFKGRKGNDKIELYYGIPFKEFKKQSDERKLELSAVVFDENEVEITRKKERRSLFVPEVVPPDQFFLDELEFEVPPGNYTLALRLEDKQAKKLGIYKLACRAPDYTAKKPIISNIQFGSEIVAGKSKSRFSKDGVLIVPYPTKVISRSSPLNIYYEIYNLTLGSDDRTLFSVEYTIRRHKGKEAISMTDVNNKTKSTDTRKYLSWDLSDTKLGKYDLIIIVEDLNSGMKDTALTTFKLIK